MRQTLQIKKQHGQVLIVILAFAAILGAGLLLLYNTTQLVTQKQQLNDAADAAAYSGAVVLAQGLNYTAYTNRAMLANSAMIGQMVTLRSTLSMSHWYWKNSETAWTAISALSKYIPYVGPVIAGIGKGITKFSDIWGDKVIYAVRKVADFLSLTGTAAIGLTNQVMWGAQQVQLAESVATFEPILIKVAKENAPEASIDGVMYGTAFGPLISLGMLAYTIEPKVRKSHRTLGTDEADKDKYLQFVTEANKNIYTVPYVAARHLIPNAVGLWIATGCDQPAGAGSLTGLFEPNAGLGSPINEITTTVQTVASLLSPIANLFMCMFERQGGTELVQLKDGHLAYTAVDSIAFKIPLVSSLVGNIPFAGGSVTSFVDDNQIGKKYPESVQYMVKRIKRNTLNQKDNKKKYFGHKPKLEADCVEFTFLGKWYTVSSTTRNDGTCAVLAPGTDKSNTDKGLWGGGLATSADKTVNSSISSQYGGFNLPINSSVLSNLAQAAQDGANATQAGGDPVGAGNLMPAGIGAGVTSAVTNGLPNTQALTQASGAMQSGLAGAGSALNSSMSGMTQLLNPMQWINGSSMLQLIRGALGGDPSQSGSDGDAEWYLRILLESIGAESVLDLIKLKISDGVESPTNRSVNKAFRILGDGLPKWFWDVRVQPVKVGNPKPFEAYNLTMTDDDPQDYHPRRYGLGPLVYAPLIMDTSKIKTAQNFPMGGKMMGLPDYTPGARAGIRAMGKARVFYRQPSDHWLNRYKTQLLPNLLLPYWQARNEGLSYADKWGLLALDGLTGAYSSSEAQVGDP